jgi:hypothetical protein
MLKNWQVRVFYLPALSAQPRAAVHQGQVFSAESRPMQQVFLARPVPGQDSDFLMK